MKKRNNSSHHPHRIVNPCSAARQGREGGPHISSADRRECDEGQRAGFDTADLIGI
ncbi:MAG: hypothetical protein A4E28_00244 [Methanocella sp. PtaU1.Bin125]|nr:MAG: hypothetical protein A4E28_00244 [Methanocella sp. PtaU1.Bin125]